MTLADLHFALTLDGKVDVRERGEQEEGDRWAVIDLVIDKDAEIDLAVSFDEEEGCTIKLSAFHIENDETKRAFHTHVNARIASADIARLRRFLELVQIELGEK